MNIWSKKLFVVLGLSLTPLSMALAQSTYPSQPIRLMVGYAPGGSVDIMAREYAQLLGKELKQSVVVENRGGASGTVAAQAVVRSPADGYTLYFVGSPTVTITPAMQDLSFDPLNDFQPIATVASFTNVLIVHAQSPYKDIKDLVADAKANPRKLTYGSGGVGASKSFVRCTARRSSRRRDDPCSVQRDCTSTRRCDGKSNHIPIRPAHNGEVSYRERAR